MNRVWGGELPRFSPGGERRNAARRQRRLRRREAWTTLRRWLVGRQARKWALGALAVVLMVIGIWSITWVLLAMSAGVAAKWMHMHIEDEWRSQ